MGWSVMTRLRIVMHFKSVKCACKYALICIYVKNSQNMHLHMQVCKCITIRSLAMTQRDAEDVWADVLEMWAQSYKSFRRLFRRLNQRLKVL